MEIGARFREKIGFKYNWSRPDLTMLNLLPLVSNFACAHSIKIEMREQRKQCAHALTV